MLRAPAAQARQVLRRSTYFAAREAGFDPGCVKTGPDAPIHT